MTSARVLSLGLQDTVPNVSARLTRKSQPRKGGDFLPSNEICPHAYLLCPRSQIQRSSYHRMSTFSFSFSGEDIEDSSLENFQTPTPPPPNHAAETGTLRRASSSAFPIAGQPMLPARRHELEVMLKELPSKISYSTLIVTLGDGKTICIPRRELWDVRVQLMAEEDDEGLGNLGKDDVRTGVYEGGFKSWESSVDVVKVLNERKGTIVDYPSTALEVRLHPLLSYQQLRCISMSMLTCCSLGVELPCHPWLYSNGHWRGLVKHWVSSLYR